MLAKPLDTFNYIEHHKTWLQLVWDHGRIDARKLMKNGEIYPAPPEGWDDSMWEPKPTLNQKLK